MKFTLESLPEILPPEDYENLLLSLSVEDRDISSEQLALTIRSRAETARRRNIKMAAAPLMYDVLEYIGGYIGEEFDQDNFKQSEWSNLRSRIDAVLSKAR